MFNIWNSSIKGEWMTSLDLMGTHSSPSQLTSIFASLEATDSTSSLPYPSVLLQFLSRVHQCSKKIEADGPRRRHQYSPVYRQLANYIIFKTAIPGIHPLGMHLVESLGWIKFLKIRFISNSINQSLVTIRLQGRSSLPNSKEIYCLLGKTVTMLKASHLSSGKLMSL